MSWPLYDIAMTSHLPPPDTDQSAGPRDMRSHLWSADRYLDQRGQGKIDLGLQ